MRDSGHRVHACFQQADAYCRVRARPCCFVHRLGLQDFGDAAVGGYISTVVGFIASGLGVAYNPLRHGSVLSPQDWRQHLAVVMFLA